MKILKRIVSVGVITLIACIGIVAPVNAVVTTVMYEHLNTGGDGDSSHIYGPNETAMTFTAGTASHTVDYIKAWLKRVGSPGTVIADLVELDGGGNPSGVALASASLIGDYFDTSYLPLKFPVSGDNLQSGNQYAIVVSAPTGDSSNYVMWEKDSGGGLADAVGLHSVDGGNNWISDTPADYLFEVWGSPCMSIVSALVTSDFLQSGDLLFTMEYINVYPPNYQKDVPSQDFELELLDTDGVTVIASTPMLNWGDMPGSLYLNADAVNAKAITKGGAYSLAVTGLFSPYPTVVYPIKASEWSGNIDAWVIQTAHNMEAYYSTNTSIASLTTGDLQNGGKILNKEGGDIFSPAIPGLMRVHPELFNAVVITPTVPVQTVPTVTAGSNGNWQITVGPTIAAFMNDLGAIFGASGKAIGTMMILGLYLSLVLVLVSKGAHVMGGLAVGTPMLFVGTSTFLFDLQPILGVGMIVGFIVLIGYFVTRT